MTGLKYDTLQGVGAEIEKRFDLFYNNDMTDFEPEYEKKLMHFVALNLKCEMNDPEGIKRL